MRNVIHLCGLLVNRLMFSYRSLDMRLNSSNMADLIVALDNEVIIEQESQETILRCQCTGMCARKCNCKSNGRQCTENCGCNRWNKPCKNRPTCISDAAARLEGTCTSNNVGSSGVNQQSPEQIRLFVNGLNQEQLQTLCVRLLENVGGISQGQLVLGMNSGNSIPPSPDNTPDWCKCGKCRPMPNPIENVCCGKRVCVALYEAFHMTCLNATVLRIAVRNNCDWRADAVIYNNTAFRKAAYRQYILWVYDYLGRGNRRVAPSCVVLKIRATYPSDDGTYMGFRES